MELKIKAMYPLNFPLNRFAFAVRLPQKRARLPPILAAQHGLGYSQMLWIVILHQAAVILQ